MWTTIDTCLASLLVHDSIIGHLISLLELAVNLVGPFCCVLYTIWCIIDTLCLQKWYFGGLYCQKTVSFTQTDLNRKRGNKQHLKFIDIFRDISVTILLHQITNILCHSCRYLSLRHSCQNWCFMVVVVLQAIFP